jgi:hypothetical protein
VIWGVLYAAGFLVTWVIATRGLYDPNDEWSDYATPTAAAFGGFGAGLIWPVLAVVFVGYYLFKCVGEWALKDKL